MKLLLFMLILLQPGICLADGLILQNGRFGEKEYGESVYFNLTKEQSQNLLKKDSDFFARNIQLTQKQKDLVFQKSHLHINRIFLFDSTNGYGDCACGGVPANLASLIENNTVQLPRCFIQDEYMESHSKELSPFNITYNEKGEAVKSRKTISKIQLEGSVGDLPVTMQLNFPKDKSSVIYGEYTYQSGAYKGQTFTLLGKYLDNKTFTIREYQKVSDNKNGHTYTRQTAKLSLVKISKLIGKDQFQGTLTNSDGTKYTVSLQKTRIASSHTPH